MIGPRRLALLVWTCAACGHAGGAAPDLGGGDVEAACEESQDQQQRFLARCFGASPDQGPTPPSLVAWRCAELAAKVAAGTVAFSPGDAAACSQALASGACSPTLPAACSTVFTGAVAAGGACVASSDCASGVCDALSAVAGPPGSCPGHCLATVDVGGACSKTQPCRPGLIGVASSSGAGCTCFALPGAGGACLVGGTCAAGNWCDATNTCQPQRAIGDACGGGAECPTVPPSACVAHVCVRYRQFGESCDAATNLCVAGTLCSAGACAALPILGESCGLVGGQSVDCYDADCSAPADPVTGQYQTTGQCAARPSTGEACDASSAATFFTACAPGSVCQGGTCLADACYW